ncbi:MAG: PHP domain-containing protein [Lentisphaeria bacterium]|nr:PHP domain-containing protein [Lentisphaeria bacterium]
MTDGMKRALNSFDAAARADALECFRRTHSAFNMHCHSFYSYNGYGYSPSMLAALAKELNWRGVMLVDFDVLDGVDEFLAAARALGVKAAAGMETRVFVPDLADREINSPGEPGIAYHLGCGFTSSAVPESQRAFAADLKARARRRTRTLVEKVNTLLTEIAVDFDAVAEEFTPAGNVTERHVCAAYRAAAEKRFAGQELAAYWQEKIGVFDADPVKMEALIRARTMKSGGVGYVKAAPESFPTLEEMNRFIKACGATPTLAWLNGLSAGEGDVDALLDLHIRYGAGAATLIPDRNWRASDPEKGRKLVAELDRFVAAALRRGLPLLAGTEMNAPGQLLADDYTIDELKKHQDTFLAGVDAFAK